MKNEPVVRWMTKEPITIGPKTTLPEAHSIMITKKIRRLPVVNEDGRLIGIVTLGDVREASPSDATSLSIFELNYLLAKLTIDRVMTREPISITPETTLSEAAQLMLKYKIGGLPVVENEKVVGIITESDIFRVLVQALGEG
ncbi:MAG: CBS domain-containing protein [Chloroflexi bacterium]|nr:CBS domain-containing protein [Chloroflexota bacterium]